MRAREYRLPHVDRSRRPFASAIAIARRLAAGTADRYELMESAGCSRATLMRYLADLQRELGVITEWDPSLGGYRVTDWGGLNRRWLRGSGSTGASRQS